MGYTDVQRSYSIHTDSIKITINTTHSLYAFKKCLAFILGGKWVNFYVLLRRQNVIIP